MLPTISYKIEKDEEGNSVSGNKTLDGFEKIKKNYDYCKEKNCLKELEKGGKFYKAFIELEKDVLLDSLVYASEYVIAYYGFCNEKVSKKFWDRAKELVAQNRNRITECVRNIAIDDYRSIIDELRGTFTKEYFDFVEQHYEEFYATDFPSQKVA